MTATYNAKFTAKQPDSASKTVSDLSVEMRGGSTASYMANPSTLALSGGNSAIVLTVTTTTNGVTRTIKDVKPYQPLVSFSSGTVAYESGRHGPGRNPKDLSQRRHGAASHFG